MKKEETIRLENAVLKLLKKNWYSVYELTIHYRGKFDINTYNRIRHIILKNQEKLQKKEVDGEKTRKFIYKLKKEVVNDAK